jgi:hypothetical protein
VCGLSGESTNPRCREEASKKKKKKKKKKNQKTIMESPSKKSRENTVEDNIFEIGNC